MWPEKLSKIVMKVESAEAVSSHKGSLGLPPHGELDFPGWHMGVTGLYSVFHNKY